MRPGAQNDASKRHATDGVIESQLHMVDTSERFQRFTFAPGHGSPFDPPPPPSLPVDEPEPEAHAPAVSPPLTNKKPAAIKVKRLHISQLTPERFEREHRSCGVPLIIEGALDAGAAHWRLQEFVGLFSPDATYQCRVHGGDSFATSPDMWRNRKSHARQVVWTTPGKFADTINSGIAAREDCYVQADIQGTAAGDRLAPDLARIGARCGLGLHQQYGAMANMWWGAPGHTEPLHMDVTDGTLCQLRGRKRIVLFPPSCWRDELFPFPASRSGMSWAFSQVRQSQPDLERFPRLASALQQRMELMLEEGEVLFIPACCAHEISGEPLLADGTPVEHVLSINRFWRTDPNLVRPHMPADALEGYEKSMAFEERRPFSYG